MNNSTILLCLVIIGVAAYVERDTWMPQKPAQVVNVTPAPAVAPTPQPTPARHLAPEGTFYMVGYVSVRTAHGITGFEPGDVVHFVRADREKGLLVVTSGGNQAEVTPDQITNDMDVAALARQQDQASQNQLRAIQQAQQQAADAQKMQAQIAAAKEVSHLRSGSAIGSVSSLGQGGTAASSYDAAYNEHLRQAPVIYGSPYSYLNR